MSISVVKEKFIKKFMRMARFVANDQPICPSRQIGAIIIDPLTNKVLGLGYNGAPRGTPHPNSREYLENYFWTQLTQQEKDVFLPLINIRHWYEKHTTPTNKLDSQLKEAFLDKYAGQKVCPRKLIGAKSGERSELCTCLHAEQNSIFSANVSLANSVIFIYGCTPCFSCAGALIQNGIVECHTIGGIYHEPSLWLLKEGGVKLYIHTEKLLEK